MEPYPELFARLAAKFDGGDVKSFKKGTATLTYVTARTVMNRFDDVLGPSNWWDQYVPDKDSVMCGITIRLPDGSTVTKWDAGGYAGMTDHGDDDKSGFSDAFKRAAVKWGVGRYLYRDGVPQFVRDELARDKAAENRPNVGTISSQVQHNPDPAPTPAPPMPGKAPASPVARPTPPHPETVPTTGRALYAWLRDRGEKDGVNYLKQLDLYSKTVGWPDRVIDYSPLQVGEAVNAILGVEVATA
jgi:hypothetical protein